MRYDGGCRLPPGLRDVGSGRCSARAFDVAHEVWGEGGRAAARLCHFSAWPGLRLRTHGPGIRCDKAAAWLRGCTGYGPTRIQHLPTGPSHTPAAPVPNPPRTRNGPPKPREQRSPDDLRGGGGHAPGPKPDLSTADPLKSEENVSSAPWTVGASDLAPPSGTVQGSGGGLSRVRTPKQATPDAWRAAHGWYRSSSTAYSATQLGPRSAASRGPWYGGFPAFNLVTTGCM